MNGNLAYANDGYQEETREQLIGGKIVAMSPRPTVNHNTIADNISRILGNFLDGKPCRPFGDGTDLYLTDMDHYVPDGMIVCDPEKVKRDGVYGAPDLVVEILSPGTARYDRTRKKDVYERCGVREYWMINPMEMSIEQYVLEGGKLVLRQIYYHYPDYVVDDMNEEERGTLVTEFPCTLFDDLTIRLRDVFARVTLF